MGREVRPEEIGAIGVDAGAACNNRCAICPRPSGPAPDGDALAAAIAGAEGRVVLHGGEPTLRPDLLRLIEAGRGKILSLESNGRAFAAAGAAERARAAGLASATVTLLGASEAGHDFLTRAPGSFRQTVAGARRLAAAGVALTVRVVVTRPAVPSLRAMAALALGLGARAVRFSWARADDGARAWLQPRYALALPELAAAAEAIARAGRAVVVDGVPRCLAPSPTAAEATAPACFAPSPPADAFAPRCAGCALRGGCAGVPADYLARFGDGELAPAS